jgi:hypothetical protein
MSKYEKICLPLTEKDGVTVHHTLKGEWLVGFGNQKGTPAIGTKVGEDERGQWGRANWFVIRSESGKLVVYKSTLDHPPAVNVYKSFDAMEPHVPPSIYDAAMEKAGLKQPPQIPEVPLEGV